MQQRKIAEQFNVLLASDRLEQSREAVSFGS